MNIFTKKYDNKLIKIEHFTKHPQMIPLVGKDYGNQNYKRLLIIGESHFLPDYSRIHLTPRSWYRSNHTMLDEEEWTWTYTGAIIADAKYQKYKSRSHSIYANLEKGILESGFKPIDTVNMFRYCAFYNFFVRPAILGSSIGNTPDDDEIAVNTLKEITKILKPQFICFSSIKAWKVFLKSKLAKPEEDNYLVYLNNHDIIVDGFPHAGCKHWNMKANKYKFQGKGKPLTGRMKFIKFLKFYGIFPT